MVASQLKILMPVGIAMSMLVAPKTASGVKPRPTANMWCAQTSEAEKAIAIPEPTTNA